MKNIIKIAFLGMMIIPVTACNKEKTVPSTFELIGKTRIDSVTAIAIRDKGTGCEMVYVSGALIPRYERSIDGTSVKQRCVLTGEEQPTAGGSPVITEMNQAAGQPTFQPANPVGIDAQEQALREAVRAETEAAAKRQVIPPPAQPGNTTPVAKTEDGIESQLK